MNGCVYRTEDNKCKFWSDYGKGIVSYCDPCDCEEKTVSNADRVRSMTDEELAETYAGGCPNGDRLNCGKYYLHGGRDCFRCWLDWLKAPVEEGDG